MEGRPATCLLVSDQPEAVESPARRWDESEYCIDDTQRLRILSVAPGSYTIYSYAAGQSFHGQPMPDRIKTYLGGTVVIDASLRIDEPSVAGSTPPPLTAEMIAAGPPVGLEEPLRRIIDVRDASMPGAPGSVVVNAQIGPDGKVVRQELCVATDRSLTGRALDRVKTMEFGRSEVQRQAYVEVRFLAPSAPQIASFRGGSTAPNVLAVPYYLERIISGPNSRRASSVCCRSASEMAYPGGYTEAAIGGALMARVPMWRRYLRFFGVGVKADVDEELRFHLDTKKEELMSRGLPPSEASAEAARQFGELSEVRELCVQIESRRVQTMEWRELLSGWRQDIRYAARRLRQSPGFTLTAVATLAFGIGVNSAIFSVVHTVLLKSLPYRDPDRLCWIWVTNPSQGFDRDATSYPRLQDWKNESTTFESLTRHSVSSSGCGRLCLAGSRCCWSHTSWNANCFTGWLRYSARCGSQPRICVWTA